MGKRRAARELALKFLYQTEFNSNSPDSELNSFCERANVSDCLLNTSDAAEEGLGVDLRGRRIIKKKM